MNDLDFLRLLKDVLRAETYVNCADKVLQARREVAERIEALTQEEMEQADLAVNG